MQLREWLNNNPSVVTIGAVVLLLICLGLIVNQLTGSSSTPDGILFVDMNTNTFVEVPINSHPPVPAESGTEPLVRGHFFSCGSCEDIQGDIDPGDSIAEAGALGVTLLYVEKYTDEDLAKLNDPENVAYVMRSLRAFVDGEAIGEFQMVNDEDVDWNEEFRRRLDALCEDGERPRPCSLIRH